MWFRNELSSSAEVSLYNATDLCVVLDSHARWHLSLWSIQETARRLCFGRHCSFVLIRYIKLTTLQCLNRAWQCTESRVGAKDFFFLRCSDVISTGFCIWIIKKQVIATSMLWLHANWALGVRHPKDWSQHLCVIISITVCWNVTTCSVVSGRQLFKETVCSFFGLKLTFWRRNYFFKF
jgi:hypothetical protein